MCSSEPSVFDIIALHGERFFRATSAAVAPHSQKIFIKYLYEVLDEIIRNLEADADMHSKHDETEISRCIVRQVQQAKYRATSETYERGHVDICINSGDGKVRWLAESKIHSDYDKLTEGMKQLLSRYSTGRDPDGGFFVFVKNQGCDTVIEEWKKRIESNKVEKWKKTSDDATKRCFRTEHEHDSGADYRVRHMGVHLYYQPRDKSAVNARCNRRLVRGPSV